MTEEKLEDIKFVNRSRKSYKTDAMAKRKNDKHWSTKQYTEKTKIHAQIRMITILRKTLKSEP